LKIQGRQALPNADPLTRLIPGLFIVIILLYATASRASIQNGDIEFAHQIVDRVNVLRDETKSSEISKKPARQLDKYLKKTIKKLEKVIEIQQRGNDRKLGKEYKKLKHAMDRYMKLLSHNVHHGKKGKHGKIDPEVVVPLLASAEDIQIAIDKLISGDVGNIELDPDRDGDGISGNSDHCPGTSIGEITNSIGCSPSQLDSDYDGVDNAADRCPGTFSGETVDALGCAATELDSDNDTVADDLDQCPNTLPGITVDNTGCPIIVADDIDRDTIADATDNCPSIFNPDQADTDTDGIGDACEIVGSITITNPIPGQMINTSTTSVTGTFNGPAGSGVMVNSRQACVYDNQFVINNIPVNTGDHLIIAQIIPAVGIGESTLITINRDGDSLYTVEPNTNCAVAPFDARFTLDNLDASILQIDIDYDNNGVTDANISDLSNPLLLHTYTNPGNYQVKITGFDTASQLHNQSLSIIVQDGVAIDAVIQAGWQNITAGLSTNNIAQALIELTPNAREKYGPVFDALRGNLPAILSTFSSLQVVDINTDYAEYAINRTIDGENRLFLIYFVKDENGEWKLDEM